MLLSTCTLFLLQILAYLPRKISANKHEMFIEIFNKNFNPIKIMQLNYTETFGSEVLHQETWKDLPAIKSFTDSDKMKITVSTFPDSRATHTWNILVHSEAKDESYKNSEPLICYLRYEDKNDPISLIVDLMRGVFIISPAASDSRKVTLVKTN